MGARCGFPFLVPLLGIFVPELVWEFPTGGVFCLLTAEEDEGLAMFPVGVDPWDETKTCAPAVPFLSLDIVL